MFREIKITRIYRGEEKIGCLGEIKEKREYTKKIKKIGYFGEIKKTRMYGRKIRSWMFGGNKK